MKLPEQSFLVKYFSTHQCFTNFNLHYILASLFFSESMADMPRHTFTSIWRRISVVASTSAWHAFVRGSIPGPGMLY